LLLASNDMLKSDYVSRDAQFIWREKKPSKVQTQTVGFWVFYR